MTNEQKIISELREWLDANTQFSGYYNIGIASSSCLGSRLTELEQKYCNSQEILVSSEHIPDVGNMVKPKLIYADSLLEFVENSSLLGNHAKSILKSYILANVLPEKPQANKYEMKIEQDLLYSDQTIEIDAFGNVCGDRKLT